MTTLHNGIELPDLWPLFITDMNGSEPIPVPYLKDIPVRIPIDSGRQLFVDDFLIETTSLLRVYHRPRKHETNPVFKPETNTEKNTGANSCATPKGGGVWRDPKDGLFKMWYEAGWLNALALAVSRDGLKWERPDWGVVPGTNRLLPEYQPDSNTVWIDESPGCEAERYKLFFREPDNTPATPGVVHAPSAFLMTSPDGIHWSEAVVTGPTGDRSTCYYDPFRKKWVFSLRSYSPQGRCRSYWESETFMEGGNWKKDEPSYWLRTDHLDKPGSSPAQLYNFDAVAYESLMLGMFQIHTGPANDVCEKEGLPKNTQLHIAFSRDGLHWHRPDREPFIPSDPRPGSWERGYVQSVGGVCLVGRDEIWFYYSAFSGDPERRNLDWKHNGMYANGSTGLAFLRRDGFASMEAGEEPGELLTRPLTFSGDSLWINGDASSGYIRVECLNEKGELLPEWSSTECIPIHENGTCLPVKWKNGKKLGSLAGQPVRLRFKLQRASLYSFWVSSDPGGESGGYKGAGSPDVAPASSTRL